MFSRTLSSVSSSGVTGVTVGVSACIAILAIAEPAHGKPLGCRPPCTCACRCASVNAAVTGDEGGSELLEVHGETDGDGGDGVRNTGDLARPSGCCCSSWYGVDSCGWSDDDVGDTVQIVTKDFLRPLEDRICDTV